MTDCKSLMKSDVVFQRGAQVLSFCTNFTNTENDFSSTNIRMEQIAH